MIHYQYMQREDFGPIVNVGVEVPEKCPSCGHEWPWVDLFGLDKSEEETKARVRCWNYGDDCRDGPKSLPIESMEVVKYPDELPDLPTRFMTGPVWEEAYDLPDMGTLVPCPYEKFHREKPQGYYRDLSVTTLHKTDTRVYWNVTVNVETAIVCDCGVRGPWCEDLERAMDGWNDAYGAKP